MSNTEQPAKRRRLDAANLTLRKPFRSPLLKRPVSKSLLQPTPSGDSPTTSAGSPAMSRRSRAGVPAHGSTLSPAVAHGDAETVANTQTMDDALRQRKKELEGQVKQVRQQLELAQQAQRIEASSLKKRPGEDIDNELKDLIQKWRGAGRLAAEELFDLIKGRVDSMGGARAWRDTRQRQREIFPTDQHAGTNELGEGKSREDAADKREVLEGDEPGNGPGEEDILSAEDDSSKFTIAMMLKSLGIDPKLIGFTPADLDDPC